MELWAMGLVNHTHVRLVIMGETAISLNKIAPAIVTKTHIVLNQVVK